MHISNYPGPLLRAVGAGVGADLPDPLLRADRPRGASRVAAGRVPRRHLARLHHAALAARHPPRLLPDQADQVPRRGRQPPDHRPAQGDHINYEGDWVYF